jgi:hypothetical protein
VPDAGDAFQRVELVATVIDADAGDSSSGPGEGELPRLKWVVQLPRLYEGFEFRAVDDSDRRPNRDLPCKRLEFYPSHRPARLTILPFSGGREREHTD